MPTEQYTVEAEAARVCELRRWCESSRATRRVTNQTLRTWYELGTSAGNESPYNKIFSHLRRLKSYVFAPGTTRFAPHLPAASRRVWIHAANVARDEFRSAWRDSGADMVAAMMIEWSFVFGCTLGKVQEDRGGTFRLGYIDPGDFGVSRESVPTLDEQDIVAHWYNLSIPQIERIPGVTERVIEIAHAHKTAYAAGRYGRPGLVVTGVSGAFPNSSVQGAFPGDADFLSGIPEPEEIEESVTFCDVWERREYHDPRDPKLKRLLGKSRTIQDWKVTTTIADVEEIVVGRRNPVLPWTASANGELPGELPFVVMCPRPLPNYFWGRSELKMLRWLQDWLNDHRADMKRIIKRELDPSTLATGIPDADEYNRAMKTPGGSYASPEPNSKMQQLEVRIGDEAFKIDQMIQSAFDDQSGIPGSLSEPGSVPGGVRSTGQFSMVAGIGAGQVQETALWVEEGLSDAATKAFHVCQRHDPTAYPVEDGEVKEFLLADLPSPLTLSVDAHSGAPIFREQRKADAMMLRKGGAISAEDFAEMVVPDREDLRAKAKGMDKARSEAAQEKLQIEHEKATRGKRPR